MGAQTASEPHDNVSEEPSLVDRLIDSPLEWRQLFREANGGEWSLRQLPELQLKRQEVIHELVQTERHHCLTLALMRQVYLAGLRRLNERRSAGYLRGAAQGQQLQPLDSQPDLIDLERLFPALEDLIQAHELFFAHLRLRLVECCDLRRLAQQQPPQAAPAGQPEPGGRPLVGLVGRLGDLLCEQFRLEAPRTAADARRAPKGCSAGAKDGGRSGGAGSALGRPANGQKLLQAYAKFCGHHSDSTRYYKQLLATDKQFRGFIEVSRRRPA